MSPQSIMIGSFQTKSCLGGLGGSVGDIQDPPSHAQVKTGFQVRLSRTTVFLRLLHVLTW